MDDRCDTSYVLRFGGTCDFTLVALPFARTQRSTSPSEAISILAGRMKAVGAIAIVASFAVQRRAKTREGWLLLRWSPQGIDQRNKPLILCYISSNGEFPVCQAKGDRELGWYVPW